MNEDLKEKIDDIWEFVNDCEEKRRHTNVYFNRIKEFFY